MAADFGMTSLKLESLSFLEQICLFAKADLIVAEHGAGLTNLLFSSDCRVVELLPSGFGNWAYPAIAALKQVEFNRVIGSSMTSLEAGRIWSIDAVSLRTALQQLSV
jgi:capsular polysaccharide biosynthesis protein